MAYEYEPKQDRNISTTAVIMFFILTIGGGMTACTWWFEDGSPAAIKKNADRQAGEDKYWADHWTASQAFIKAKRDEIQACYDRGGVASTRGLPWKENPYPNESNGIHVLARCDFPPPIPTGLRIEK